TYVFGGFNVSGYLSTVEAYDPSTNSWTTRASMPTARRHLAAVAASDGYNQLNYVFGRDNNGKVPTVEAYNPITNKWTTKASMPTARQELAAVRGSDGRIYVFGGDSGNGS